jgi:hypothetical protein
MRGRVWVRGDATKSEVSSSAGQAPAATAPQRPRKLVWQRSGAESASARQDSAPKVELRNDKDTNSRLPSSSKRSAEQVSLEGSTAKAARVEVESELDRLKRAIEAKEQAAQAATKAAARKEMSERERLQAKQLEERRSKLEAGFAEVRFVGKGHARLSIGCCCCVCPAALPFYPRLHCKLAGHHSKKKTSFLFPGTKRSEKIVCIIFRAGREPRW